MTTPVREPDPVVDGTLISSPDTGLFYYSPYRYHDGAEAFRTRRADFYLVQDRDLFFARLRARLAELNSDIPQSPGEYAELA